jgi:signal transduction histidine kinase
MGGELLLARRVVDGMDRYVQGCWLDWPAIQSKLLGEIADLFPAAELKAVSPKSPPAPSRTLVSLPVALIPGPTAVAVSDGGSSVRLSLVIAWSAMLLAALAVAALLFGTLSLSERRAAFVSAVTHELRTPLTTFRLYADLLMSDSAPDPAKQRAYASTLSAEASRLSHLVENVLTYARLERGRSPATLDVVPLADLVDRLRPTLEQRLAPHGLTLLIHTPSAERTVALRTDPAAVERILLNLADNAAKYAIDSEPRLVRIDIVMGSRNVEIHFRDYGPGIPPSECRRLFRPFARRAGSTIPGVGLGLALSRRLAHHVGGELRLDSQVSDGAAFVLIIPTN